jgi:hypothetical protein
MGWAQKLEPGGLQALKTQRRYSDTQVWSIFKSMNWSCQRPAGGAIQRDEGATQEWKKSRWSALKIRPKNLEAIVDHSRDQLLAVLLAFFPWSPGYIAVREKTDGRALVYITLEEISDPCGAAG